MDFKKSNKFSNIHKNIFFGLSYLHALLPGRHRYGTLGWNMPYEFGESDFEICNAQLTLAMKLSNGTSSKKVNIKVYMTMLRYMFAQINYGGKISRP
jgi:dynein heavy chain